jgi:protocatechuate 3,4-dioxygenase beta subunit
MKLRLIPAILACAALTSGFAAAVPAHASTLNTQHPATGRPAPGGIKAGVKTMSPSSRPSGRAGVITGTVTGAGHKPLAGACVVASGPAGAAMAMTNPEGRYAINPLRPGRYTLHFSDCSAPGRYLDQWSGGVQTPAGASSLAVAAGRVRDAGRVTLHSITSAIAAAGTRIAVQTSGAGSASAAPGRPIRVGTSASAAGKGAIAGRVTGNGKPLKGICVSAYPRRGRGARVRTSASGRYRIGSLTPGSYIVAFANCSRKSNWIGQYYRNAGFFSRHRPTRIPVRAGRTARGINAHLQLGGEIDGTVRDAHGRPLAEICAEAEGKSGRRFVFGSFTRTSLSGHFVMHALIPASYVVYFQRCGNRGNYAPVFWKNSQTRAHATKIVVKSGSVVRHIDPVMPAGGVISGTVRAKAQGGKRLRGICVYAESRNGFGFTITGRGGGYRIIGLATGKYRMFFERCRSRANVLPQQRSVSVRIGHTVSGFDVSLPPGAIATGVVRDVHGNPVSGICVEFQGKRRFGGGRTGADGTYSVNALQSGSYRISFTGGCGNSGSYAPQFYRGESNIAAADRIELTAGRTKGGLNARMQPGATITGNVTDAQGNPVNDVCITFTPVGDLEFGFFFFSNLTIATHGSYAAANLTPGLYAVNFGCFFGTRTLARQWFMAKADQGSANLVSARAGAVTSGISAALQQGGSIAGTVTNRNGTPLARICVQATAQGSQVLAENFGPGSAATGKNGGYVLRNLPPGTYVLHFTECGRGVYGSRWYDKKATEQAATPVTVTAGGATTGIDETLAPGGSISGIVRSASGTALPGACVIANDQATESEGFGQADRTGHYTVAGLSTGSYQVTFYPCRRTKPRLAASARPAQVAVHAPGAVTGINGKLGVAGSITGTVRDEGGKLQAGICVAAVAADASNVTSYGTTGQRGAYQIRGLGAGTYHVYVGDAFCPTNLPGPAFAPQWYKGQQTQATATDVTVTAGSATAGISATLRANGTISGTVTHQSNPVAGECVTAYPVNPTPDPLFGETLNPVIGVTASDGGYSLVDLLPGQYQVRFSVGCGASGFGDQWWDNASSQSSATTITVAANGDVTGINASLP